MRLAGLDGSGRHRHDDDNDDDAACAMAAVRQPCHVVTDQ